MTDLAALRRVEDSLRAYVTRGRLKVHAGALCLFATTDNPNPFLSVAVPSAEDPEDWDGSIESLKRAAADHGLRPRLEFMAELHPGLATALQQAGFHRTGSAPVMMWDSATTTAASVRDSVPTEERNKPEVAVSYHDLSVVDEPTLVAYLDGQSRAFEMPIENGRAWLNVLRRGLHDGSVRGGLLESNGRPVAGATLQLAEPAGELAGVWSQAELRHKGLASTVCRMLLQDATEAGLSECWLSSAEEALGLYGGLGFRQVGTQLNFER